MPDTVVHVLGVKHTDSRIHDGIDEEATQVGPPDVIYHEMPESAPNFWEFTLWMFLKNPAGIIPSLIYFVRSMLTTRLGFGVGSDGRTYVKTECRVAAERLRDEYDAHLVNIGMNRLDLLKRRSWLTAATSWAITIVALAIIVSVLSSGNLSHLWALIVPLALSMMHRVRTLDNIRDTRDEHMANQIRRDSDSANRTKAIAIVGQKHVEGIGVVLGVGGYSPNCRWITREEDYKGNQ